MDWHCAISVSQREKKSDWVPNGYICIGPISNFRLRCDDTLAGHDVSGSTLFTVRSKTIMLKISNS